ncbi:MAG: GGDEF domain-containing protein [Pseudomonadota bacterium]
MGAIHTISADDATVIEPVAVTGSAKANAPADIDPERIDAVMASGEPDTHWPAPIQSLYRDEVTERIASDGHFLFLLGLLVCLATILIDVLIDPGIAKEGAVIRILAVAPITLLGLVASARRWTRITAFCVGAAPIAFASVIVHLGVHLPPEDTAKYLAAVCMLVGFANFVLPFSMRGLIIFDIGYIAIAFATNIWSGPGDPAYNLDFLVLLAIIAIATIPIAHRFEKLRQHNFLLNLRARITSHKLLEANERLTALSERDPLTGLPNRRCFQREFDELVEARLCPENPDANANATPRCRIAVLMIDLDHFKAFNDTHGHQAGDECLRLVGRELAQSLDHVDGIATRYGGEEFVAAVCEETLGDVGSVAEEVRHKISSLLIPVGASGRSIVTASIGIALASIDGDIDRDELIKTADAALYNAKRSGRNRVKAIELEPAAVAAA